MEWSDIKIQIAKVSLIGWLNGLHKRGRRNKSQA